MVSAVPDKDVHAYEHDPVARVSNSEDINGNSTDICF